MKIEYKSVGNSESLKIGCWNAYVRIGGETVIEIEGGDGAEDSALNHLEWAKDLLTAMRKLSPEQ